MSNFFHAYFKEVGQYIHRADSWSHYVEKQLLITNEFHHLMYLLQAMAWIPQFLSCFMSVMEYTEGEEQT